MTDLTGALIEVREVLHELILVTGADNAFGEVEALAKLDAVIAEVRALREKTKAHLEWKQPEYTKPVCRGAEALGTACGICERCLFLRENPRPKHATVKDYSSLLQQITQEKE